MPLTSIVVPSSLHFGQAIPWYFITIWGGNWSGSCKKTILFCFGVTVVYITPSKLQKSYLQILSTLLQNWIFLSESCHHLLRSCCVLLVTVTIVTTLHYIYKDIRSGH